MRRNNFLKNNCICSSFLESKNEKRSLDVSVILNKVESTEEAHIATNEKHDGKKVEVKGKPTKTKSKVSCDEISIKKPTKKECNGRDQSALVTSAQTTNETNRTIQNKSAKMPEISNNSTVCAAERPNKMPCNDSGKSIIENQLIPTNGMSSGKKVDIIMPKDLNVSISNEKDLSDELFANFPLPQTPNESNPNALSPTAAFLLSFPVVSTVSSSKPTETDNSYSEGTSLLRLEEKPHQTKEHSLFESISSILNDLNDVSTGKNIANVENSSLAQYPYCTTTTTTTATTKTTRTQNNDQEKAIGGALSETNMHRNKQNLKNLHINSLLNDDKMRQVHGSNRTSESTKLPFGDEKKQQLPECSTNAVQTNSLINERTNYVTSKTFENMPSATENASDFYVSLSTLGLPLKSTATLPAAPINPPNVGSHFNFQIPTLAQSRNLIDSRPLIADTPFTFSLTKCSDTTSTVSTMSTTITTKAILQQNDDQCHNTPLSRPNKIQKKQSPTKHLVNDRFVMPAEPAIAPINRCNTFNPFSFDNPTILSSSTSIGLGNLTTSSSTSTSIATPFTFTLTPTFSSISASTPLLSNHDPLFSSSFDMPIMRSTNSLPKNPKRDKTSSAAYCGEKEHSTPDKNTKSYSTVPSTSKPSKNLVNWMTSSVNKPPQELHLDFITSPHCGATEEPSAWSPNRMTVDNTSLISSSTLPMLHGDLALNTISSNCNPTATNKFEMDMKKIPARNTAGQKGLPKIQNHHRKMEQASDRSGKGGGGGGGKSDKNLQAYKNHQHSAPVRMNEPNPITNNFHSVSQLLDQERQTSNKNNSCYVPVESKVNPLKDSNNVNAISKQKYYPKYEVETNNHQLTENKYSLNACNTIGGSAAPVSATMNDILPNECDRDLFGGYFFGQSKRLKLNYHSSSDFLSNQSFPTTYENSTANDIIPPYANYQTFDSDCNNVSTSSCINNLTNQTYSYQYTQPPQPYSHQSSVQQQSQSACDPLDTTTNYFQAPVSLSSYKPPNFNDMVRSNSKTIISSSSSSSTSTAQPSFLHQTTKSNDPIANARLFPCTTTSATSNLTSQLPMCSINRNTATACPSKTIHYPSHSNINNLPLNQAWNESSFSWMPYTNPIEKPYNNNLFNTIENHSSPKTTVTTNNISGNNNTIPNFNLTTIFPDYNKS